MIHANCRAEGSNPCGQSYQPRQLLRRLTAAVAGLLIAGSTLAHQHLLTGPEMYEALGWDFATAEVTTEQVGPSLFVLFGLGGNVAVSVGEDGVLIVDDQFPQMMPKLKAAIADLGGEGVDFVVNSHWHFDHADGNLTLGQEGAWIIAHANSRKLNTQDRTINLVGVGTYVQKAYPPHALADITFERDMHLHLNGEQVDVLHFGPAHTGGDAVVIFRGNNAVHFGDVFGAGYPFIDVDNGGSIDGMIAFCSGVLEAIDAQTKIIPGHGPVSTFADLQAYIEMLTDVRDRIAAMVERGASLEEVVAAAPTQAFDERYGDPTSFVNRAFYSLQQ